MIGTIIVDFIAELLDRHAILALLIRLVLSFTLSFHF